MPRDAVLQPLFEISREMLDVTSLHRPNLAWSHTDPAGHTYRWLVQKEKNVWVKPGFYYDAMKKYRIFGLLEVVTEHGDGEEAWTTSTFFCRRCGAQIRPGFTADDTQQFIPGLARRRINGVSVSERTWNLSLMYWTARSARRQEPLRVK